MLVWKGMGWVVPALVVAAVIIAQGLLKALGSNGTMVSMLVYAVFIVLAGVAAALLGLRLNAVVAGRRHNNHSFFFVPLQFWGALIPVLALASYAAIQVDDKNQLAALNAPQTGDYYIVNLEKAFDMDQGYRYGIAKVAAVQGDTVEVSVSNASYSATKGARKDVRRGRVEKADFFSTATLSLSKHQLSEMHAKAAIVDVIRNS